MHKSRLVTHRRLAFATIALASAFGLIADAASGQMPAQESIDFTNLVYVTEDMAIERAGCDAITAFDAGSGNLLSHGLTQISPGRLALSQDMQLAVAAQVNGSPAMHVVRFNPQTDSWHSGLIQGLDFSTLGASVVMSDSLLVSISKHSEPSVGIVTYPNLPPHYLDKYDIPAQISRNGRLGARRGRIRLDGFANEVMRSPGADTAHILTSNSSIISIDVRTMKEVADRISIEPPDGPRNIYHGPPLNYVSVSAAPDQRHMLVSQGHSSFVTIVDLVDRTSWEIPIDSQPAIVGGLAVNHAWLNPGLVAIHEVDSIVTYSLDPAQGLSEVGRVRIPAFDLVKVNWEAIGPLYSIAWNGDGSRLIAATDIDRSEFVVIGVSDGGESLEIERFVSVCWVSRNFPNDIATTNGLITPPPSVTPTETATPVPPTPSPSPSETPRASQTPTRAPSSTPTSTASTTPTPVPGAVYLPLLLRESCEPEKRRADVVLVIDASISMLDLTSTGRTKLSAAQDAALSLLAELDLAAGDQVAIVSFNTDATLVSGLSSDADAIRRAVSGIAAAPGTCIPCALEVATAELFGSRHESTNTPALVILTDGQSNVRPIAEAVALAAEAKRQGAQIFTVGLGQEIEAEALREMASRPAFFYRTLDAEALSAIFARLVFEIPCPVGEFWGRR